MKEATGTCAIAQTIARTIARARARFVHYHSTRSGLLESLWVNLELILEVVRNSARDALFLPSKACFLPACLLYAPSAS